MRAIKILFQMILSVAVLGVILGTIAMVGLYLYFSPNLPNVDTLKEVHFQTPMQVYSKDHKLIAEFGEKRRTPIKFNQVPLNFVHALQAAEDARFFEHNGVDIKGLARAVVQLATTGKKKGGGSTITMQVAKNFFLTREKSFSRKFSEILLALKIESSLSKEKIFELYINKIYLGHRSYGIQAASYVYYGKNINQINLAQLAMIAGLPKAPSSFNPIRNPTRAIVRRNWIIGRMLGLDYISKAEHDQAISQPVTAYYHSAKIQLYAPYIAEMVRKQLYQKYGDSLYTSGYQVITTVDSTMQASANLAVQNGLLAYVKRHGYRGPEKQIQISTLDSDARLEILAKELTHANIEPALVLQITDKDAIVLRKNGEHITLPWKGMAWARKFKSVNSMGPKPKKAVDILAIGDLVRIRQELDNKDQSAYWGLSQIPKVQGAMIAMAPENGAVLSLVGGFSFTHNKFNRATQALRQPGSNLKPFIYGAALQAGYTAATTINDAPIVLQGASLQANWRPENSSRKFYGPTRLRVGLYKSRNLVSIRLLRAIGIDYALDYLAKFGFDRETLPQNLSLSLGAADLTPISLIGGYGPIANGGYRIDTFFIDKILSPSGAVIFQEKPRTVITTQVLAEDQYSPAPRIIDARDSYVIYSILKDVIRRGTATKARVLKRNDLAGKTGTTNLQRDAWFTGFNSKIVATVWVGYDNPAPLGRREFGGTAALPIWIDFMSKTLAGEPEAPLKRPPGLVNVTVNAKTGLRARHSKGKTVSEIIKSEDARRLAQQSAEINDSTTDDLFN
ncbi:MAG: penicillin-binding protein [Osedax symbiont Rs1]|nr:MAG: penicillin-binding protein [Osedax symbiont Rs1]